ncbi:unnamed protein product [Alopecurus aequalis]
MPASPSRRFQTGSAPMEEFQEADVLWPETPPPPAPPWGDREGYQPELYEATATAALGFSGESFGTEHAASSLSSASSSSSSAPPSGRGSSDGFLSDVPSTFAGVLSGDDASFQEADVLWPDEDYATRERELWWLCCGLADAAAAGSRAEPAAGGKRSRAPFVSSPIDIPTGVANAAARRRRPTALPVHRGSIRMGGLRQAHW